MDNSGSSSSCKLGRAEPGTTLGTVQRRLAHGSLAVLVGLATLAPIAGCGASVSTPLPMAVKLWLSQAIYSSADNPHGSLRASWVWTTYRRASSLPSFDPTGQPPSATLYVAELAGKFFTGAARPDGPGRGARQVGVLVAYIPIHHDRISPGGIWLGTRLEALTKLGSVHSSTVSGPRAEKTGLVPDLIGLNEYQAWKILLQDHLLVKVKLVADTQDVGTTVLRESPSAGRSPRNGTVIITVSWDHTRCPVSLCRTPEPIGLPPVSP